MQNFMHKAKRTIIREIFKTNRETWRSEQKPGDSRVNRETWQVCNTSIWRAGGQSPTWEAWK